MHHPSWHCHLRHADPAHCIPSPSTGSNLLQHIHVVYHGLIIIERWGSGSERSEVRGKLTPFLSTGKFRLTHHACANSQNKVSLKRYCICYRHVYYHVYIGTFTRPLYITYQSLHVLRYCRQVIGIKAYYSIFKHMF